MTYDFPHHDVLVGQGYALPEPVELGTTGKKTLQLVYRHPGRPDESVEIYPTGSHSHGPVWAHRTKASGTGTGIRPKGGESHRSLAKYLRGLA